MIHTNACGLLAHAATHTHTHARVAPASGGLGPAVVSGGTVFVSCGDSSNHLCAQSAATGKPNPVQYQLEATDIPWGAYFVAGGVLYVQSFNVEQGPNPRPHYVLHAIDVVRTSIIINCNVVDCSVGQRHQPVSKHMHVCTVNLSHACNTHICCHGHLVRHTLVHRPTGIGRQPLRYSMPD